MIDRSLFGYFHRQSSEVHARVALKFETALFTAVDFRGGRSNFVPCSFLRHTPISHIFDSWQCE